ncbi:MAG: glycerophosphodiester phosphodiesterase [Alphaproteobacteria bacterium]
MDGAPENTMAAFAHAVELGYRYVETDVHATADGVLLAFHDDKLDRVTDRVGVIAELPYAEVKLARVDGTHPIPTFDELLNAWPDLRLNIDPKADNAEGPLIEALQRADALDRICIGSFSGARLGRLRAALGPGLCTSMGPWDVARLRFASWGLPTGRFAANCAQVPEKGYGIHLPDRAFVRAAHARGLKVHVWTINDEASMRRLLDVGVDGIVSDETKLLKRVLQERGQWP